MRSLYLVTGGAGFIGSSIVRALLARGERVRVIDDFSSGRGENLPLPEDEVAPGASDRRAPALEVIEASILEPAALAHAVEDVDVVFHEAAIASVPRSMAEPAQNHEVNVTGTLRVLLAAKAAGVRRVVYAASSAAYGDAPESPKREDMPPQPLSPYAVAKLCGEQYCRIFASAYGLETVCLRYFNVFGPHQDPASDYAAVIPRFITAVLAGRTPVIYGDGRQSRDFCFSDNVVDANLAAVVAPGASGGVYNIGCGVETDLLTVVRTLGDVLGRAIEPRHEPPRPGDIQHSLADIGAARAALSYRPAVSFRDGIERTVAWYRDAACTPLREAAAPLGDEAIPAGSLAVGGSA